MEKTVAVKLIARVEQYLAAMAAASGATTGLATTAQTSMTKLGTSMAKVGGSMTRYLTLPLAAVGVGATVMAANFEESFAQMQGLAGVTADEVEGLKESVLDLAGETARGPQELAEALYLAKSSGLETAEAMDVVDMAAHAAAAGMGSTTNVVNLLTSVLGSYGSANIDAARAADILTAAVREGRAEPEEMAQALGRVLPIAASMGITFEEVAGATAFLTNAGLQTDEAVTALRGTMLALLDPTAIAAKELVKAGTSVEELKAAIDEGGLLGALQLLREHGFEPGSQALSNLVEDNHALVGATALLADANGDLVPIIDSVTDSVGDAGDAFSTVSDTDAFKFKQAVVDIQTAMIEIGAIILPVAAKIGSAIGDLAGWFADLPGPVQTMIVVLGGLAAAAGPVLVVAGSLMRSWQTLSSVMGASTGIMSTAGLALAGIALAATAGYLIYQHFSAGQREVSARTTEVGNALFAATQEAWAYAAATGEAGGSANGFAVAQRALAIALTTTGEDGRKLTEALGELGIQTEEAFVILQSLKEDPVAALMAVGEAAGYASDEQLILARTVADVENISRTGMLKALELTALGMGASAAGAIQYANALIEPAMAMEELQDQSEKVKWEDLAEGFLNTATASSTVAEGLIDQAEAQEIAADGVATSLEIYQRLAENLGSMTEAERAAALEALGLSQAQLAAAASGEEFTGSLEESEGIAGSMVDTTSDLVDWFYKAAKYATDFAEALRKIVEPGQNYIDAQEGIWRAALKFNEAIDESSRSIEINSEAGLDNRDVLQDWADQVIGLADEQLAAGEGLADVSRAYQHNRTALLDAAEAAGFNRDEVEAMLIQYGLVPDLVDTAIVLTGDAQLSERLKELLAQYDDIPPEKVTEIEALIDEGKYAEAERLIRELESPRSMGITITANTQPALDAIKRLSNVPVYVSVHSGARYGFASGGYVPARSNIPATVGEQGDEVILPLTNPARMASLLGMPLVGPRVWAAMTGGAGASTGANLPPIIIHNNGRDLTPGDVARAIEMSRTAA